MLLVVSFETNLFEYATPVDTGQDTKFLTLSKHEMVVFVQISKPGFPYYFKENGVCNQVLRFIWQHFQS